MKAGEDEMCYLLKRHRDEISNPSKLAVPDNGLLPVIELRRGLSYKGISCDAFEAFKNLSQGIPQKRPIFLLKSEN